MDPIEELRKLGYEVQKFTEWHHRVDYVLDFWVNRYGWKWLDLATGERGKELPEKFVEFVRNHVGQPRTSRHVSKAEFIRRLVALGRTPGESERAWKDLRSSRTSSSA